MAEATELIGLRPAAGKHWEVLRVVADQCTPIVCFPTRAAAVAFIRGMRFAETGNATPIKYGNRFIALPS